jgi:hypothetical protein
MSKLEDMKHYFESEEDQRRNDEMSRLNRRTKTIEVIAASALIISAMAAIWIALKTH